MQTRGTLTKSLLATSMLTGLAAPALAADLGTVEVIPVAPVVDQHNISGVIGLYGGYITSGGDGENYDAGVVGGSGKANLWLSPAASLQLDAWGEATNGVGADADSYSNFGIASHLAWRDPNHYAIGGLVSYGSNGNTLGAWYNLALQGQVYLGNTTLYGQVGYTGGASGSPATQDGGYDGFYAFGEARYFFTPNLMAAGHLAYDNISYSGCGGNCDTFRWGLDLEIQHHNTGVTGFLSYDGANGIGSYTNFRGVTEHALLAGVKLLLGQGSLLENDRRGATFADHNPMFGETRIRTYVID